MPSAAELDYLARILCCYTPVAIGLLALLVNKPWKNEGQTKKIDYLQFTQTVHDYAQKLNDKYPDETRYIPLKFLLGGRKENDTGKIVYYSTQQFPFLPQGAQIQISILPEDILRATYDSLVNGKTNPGTELIAEYPGTMGQVFIVDKSQRNKPIVNTINLEYHATFIPPEGVAFPCDDLNNKHGTPNWQNGALIFLDFRKAKAKLAIPIR